jgi:predicted glycoside hydrolase/deacetylase ChbG (UPF0249 family)
MIKLIINADDCGNTAGMNSAIGDCIEEGIISSTTVMAVSGGGQFITAVELYKQYSDNISFGAHLNLTSGEPLSAVHVPCFLQEGFCKKDNGKVLFNGLRYRWKYVSPALARAIYGELDAQLKKIEDAGIRVSHIDSHQHIHYSPWLMPIFCKLAEAHSIKRMRRPKTIVDYSVKNCVKLLYNECLLYHMRHLSKTDFFFSVHDYLNLKNKKDGIYELMCHPGHDKPYYQLELSQLRDYLNHHPEVELINYNDLK